MGLTTKHSVLAALMLLVLLLWSGAASAEDKNVAMGPPSESQNAPQMQREQSVATPQGGAAPVSSAALEAEINQALKEGRLASVTARVADNLEVTLGGSVASAAEKQRAFLIARAFREVERVKDEMLIVGESASTGTPAPPSVTSTIPGAKPMTKSTTPKESATSQAKGSKKATGKKTGPSAAPGGEQVATASRSAAAPQPGPAESKQDQHVAATPQTSAALETEINQALKDGKLGTVTARVESNSEVTLRGSVASAAEKQRAFLIARSFKEVDRVKDQVFVVEE